ncbi:MAG: AAA family ATPase [Planctomycetaceae bacterium]|nr:AAA family ATPase [Planctomycetaceae bacterium]
MSHASELVDYAPTSLSHLVGQRSVIDQVSVALDAAQIDGKRFDHSLMVGPPGLGKSALANVIACEMAEEFTEVLGQSITTPSEFNGLLLRQPSRSIVFIDEAHELKREFQTALYLALDKQKLCVKSSGGPPAEYDLASFTVLLATTDEFCLLQPLRDRMKLTLRYEYYTEEELIQALALRIRALVWDVDEEVLPQIARRSKGTPRLALRLLQSSHRVSRSLGESSITNEHLLRACELEQLDECGLGRDEQAYLRILADGPTRLNVVATILGLPTRTVSQVIEAFLIRSGLITKDKNGLRELTAKGREHVAKSSQQTV